MIINNNIPALNSVRLLKFRQPNINGSLEKVSSGQRINSAADDVAGFAVSEKLRTYIGGLNAASQNANDGLSFLQTTSGYLRETLGVVRRLKELSVQSANGTYSADDRALVQMEINQLVSEVNRISSTATYNGQNLLDGRFAQPTADGIPFASMYFHVGAGVDDQIRAYVGTFNSDSLGLTQVSVSTPEKANQAISTLDNSLKRINDQQAQLGAYENRLASVVRTVDTAKDNFQVAESKIRDTDIAATVAELTKELLVNQANIAMLSQANAQTQSILRLLA